MQKKTKISVKDRIKYYKEQGLEPAPELFHDPDLSSSGRPDEPDPDESQSKSDILKLNSNKEDQDNE
jgi:hypothetical protein